MKKNYDILNVSVELTADKDVIEYVDSKVHNLPLYKKPNKFYVNYIDDKKIYNELLKEINANSVKIRFYGEEYKYKNIIKDVIYLYDNNSIIIHDNNKFTIIGNGSFSKNHIVYFIRQAIYEEYIKDNQLLFHSAAFSCNLGNLLVGAPGKGKTTLLMECLLNYNLNYISNDLVGCNEYNVLASIIPIRLAYGTLSRFDDKEYSNLKEKKTMDLDDFLNEYKLNLDNNVEIKNIIFPNFNKANYFSINNVKKEDAFDILKSQTLNFNDDVRPYMWVNELDLKTIDKELIDYKINNLLDNCDINEISYGTKLSGDNIKNLRKVLV